MAFTDNCDRCAVDSDAPRRRISSRSRSAALHPIRWPGSRNRALHGVDLDSLQKKRSRHQLAQKHDFSSI
jgi:hypothetical protein